LWLLPKVEKFPRSFRFTVGDRIAGVGIDLLLLLVERLIAPRRPNWWSCQAGVVADAGLIRVMPAVQLYPGPPILLVVLQIFE
jgi:hypothetical protein